MSYHIIDWWHSIHCVREVLRIFCGRFPCFCNCCMLLCWHFASLCCLGLCHHFIKLFFGVIFCSCVVILFAHFASAFCSFMSLLHYACCVCSACALQQQRWWCCCGSNGCTRMENISVHQHSCRMGGSCCLVISCLWLPLRQVTQMNQTLQSVLDTNMAETVNGTVQWRLKAAFIPLNDTGEFSLRAWFVCWSSNWFHIVLFVINASVSALRAWQLRTPRESLLSEQPPAQGCTNWRLSWRGDTTWPSVTEEVESCLIFTVYFFSFLFMLLWISDNICFLRQQWPICQVQACW